ncbi:MAG: hypothetical protein GY866_11000 [Proteobacteria bacterium]|nr:hypothetical protein [Pseudomonadota bacterium]
MKYYIVFIRKNLPKIVSILLLHLIPFTLCAQSNSINDSKELIKRASSATDEVIKLKEIPKPDDVKKITKILLQKHFILGFRLESNQVTISEKTNSADSSANIEISGTFEDDPDKTTISDLVPYIAVSLPGLELYKFNDGDYIGLLPIIEITKFNMKTQPISIYDKDEYGRIQYNENDDPITKTEYANLGTKVSGTTYSFVPTLFFATDYFNDRDNRESKTVIGFGSGFGRVELSGDIILTEDKENINCVNAVNQYNKKGITQYCKKKTIDIDSETRFTSFVIGLFSKEIQASIRIIMQTSGDVQTTSSAAEVAYTIYF